MLKQQAILFMVFSSGSGSLDIINDYFLLGFV
jgi:hypothetical protein